MLGSHNHIFFQQRQIEENCVTYSSGSFEAIINQAMHQLGRYRSEYGGPVLTSEGIHVKILVTRSESSRPMLIVVNRPCERYYEARESALVNTLRYISDILAYEINDLHFSEYVARRWEVLGI